MVAVSVGELGKALEQLKGEVASSGDTYALTSIQNTVLVTTPASQEAIVEPLLGVLCEVCPSRFFVVTLNERAPALSVEAAAVCHRVGAEGVCSEIIRISLPPAVIGTVASILRAHFVSGRPTEVIFADDASVHHVGAVVGALCDVAYFDSGSFEYGLTTVSHIHDLRVKMIDFSWLRLSGWRDCIRSGFDREVLRGVLGDLREIRIIYSRMRGLRPIAVDLLSGWLVSVLRLDVVVVDETEVSLRDSRGKAMVLRREEAGQSTHDEVREVSFVDSAGRRILFRKADEFYLEVAGLPEVHFHRGAETLSLTDIVRRFFLIGESVTNYERSLRCAMRMQHSKDRVMT